MSVHFENDRTLHQNGRTKKKIQTLLYSPFDMGKKKRTLNHFSIRTINFLGRYDSKLFLIASLCFLETDMVSMWLLHWKDRMSCQKSFDQTCGNFDRILTVIISPGTYVLCVLISYSFNWKLKPASGERPRRKESVWLQNALLEILSSKESLSFPSAKFNSIEDCHRREVCL